MGPMTGDRNGKWHCKHHQEQLTPKNFLCLWCWLQKTKQGPQGGASPYGPLGYPGFMGAWFLVTKLLVCRPRKIWVLTRCSLHQAFSHPGQLSCWFTCLIHLSLPGPLAMDHELLVLNRHICWDKHLCICIFFLNLWINTHWGHLTTANGSQGPCPVLAPWQCWLLHGQPVLVSVSALVKVLATHALHQVAPPSAGCVLISGYLN